ncbi:hypothetical protein PanWU01x14_276770, partial [Parasponia andersonii]
EPLFPTKSSNPSSQETSFQSHLSSHRNWTHCFRQRSTPSRISSGTRVSSRQRFCEAIIGPEGLELIAHSGIARNEVILELQSVLEKVGWPVLDWSTLKETLISSSDC